MSNGLVLFFVKIIKLQQIYAVSLHVVEAI